MGLQALGHRVGSWCLIEFSVWVLCLPRESLWEIRCSPQTLNPDQDLGKGVQGLGLREAEYEPANTYTRMNVSIYLSIY